MQFRYARRRRARASFIHALFIYSRSLSAVRSRIRERREDTQRIGWSEWRSVPASLTYRGVGAMAASSCVVSAIANASRAGRLGASAAIKGDDVAVAMLLDVSRTIFSGRARAERMRMTVRWASGTADGVASGGRFRSSTNSRATANAPANSKYRMMGIRRYREMGREPLHGRAAKGGPPWHRVSPPFGRPCGSRDPPASPGCPNRRSDTW